VRRDGNARLLHVRLRRRALATSPLAAVLVAGALAVAGCGGGSGGGHAPAGPPTSAAPPARPALGITEDNADLLWAPGARAPAQAAPFATARGWLAALHPRYFRLLVDWAALQPTPQGAPDLSAPVDGCARGEPPCGTYPGLAGELEAIASQQRAARAQGEPEPQVVIDLLGAPAWATLPPHGCEAPGTEPAARTLRPDALAAYRALVSQLLELGRREGVALPWWAPWNEPNDPRFLAPQRASCSAAGAPLAPGAYAELARALAGELASSGGEGKLLLGELGGYATGSAHRLGVAEFVRALPQDVLCLSRDWSVHAYASFGPRARPGAGGDPVARLERALDERGGCARGARVWVTEAGAGGPRPGRARIASAAEESAGADALSVQLARWSADPRVPAIFQYSFREDPAYPVGLTDPSLRRLSATYAVWKDLAAGRPAPGDRPSTSTGG